MYTRSKTVNWIFGNKHKAYMAKCIESQINVAEGAVRAGKTVDNVFAFAYLLERTPDKLHLASGSTGANAKLNIGYANGYGLEAIFRGRYHWGKYKDNEAMFVRDGYGRDKVIIFAGGGKNDSFKKIRGNSYGMWIATEINLHADSFIKEAMNRQLAAVQRKIFWDLNPDHPKAKIYKDYLDSYAAKAAKGEFIGGYNYEHFTIFDNATMTKERIQEIISQYDQNSIWYIRDILGKRSAAEGIINVKFASVTQGQNNYFKIPVAKAQNLAQTGQIIAINVGVDFGGNGSGHAFVASGPTLGYEKLVLLCSRWYDALGTDPDALGQMFLKFIELILLTYGFVTAVYADSEEQVLINGLKKVLRENGLGYIDIRNARKAPINDRIFAMSKIVAADRLLYTDDCETWESAMQSAVWDSKQTSLQRLDNGTTDIDTMDAAEYTYERDIDRYTLR